MTFRITYSVLNADLTELHLQLDNALTKIRAGLGKEYPSQILGKAHSTGHWLENRNPADTRQLLGKFSVVSPESVSQIIDYSKTAQKKWATVGWQERARIIRKAADLISERRLEISAAMILETGKNRLEALGDVEESADLFRYYAGQLEEAQGFSRPLAKLSPNEDTRDILKPYGVFCVISPFNFPLALAAGMAGGALLGGNSVILKPSQETPWSAVFLYEVLRDAGLPEGVFQLAFGTGSELGAALTSNPNLDGIVFTGSKEIGMKLFHSFSVKYPKPCFLEMGGKNPAIVCESADLDIAAEGCVRSAFGLTGQKCSALSRLYLHKNIEKTFLEKFLTRARELKIGDPTDKDTFVGPLINATAWNRHMKAVEEARTSGEILLGGGDAKKVTALLHGHFVEPVLCRLPENHRIWKDELFSPFLAVTTFEDFPTVIYKANQVDYGLTGGIYSAKQTEIAYFMDNLEAGVLYSNRKTGATTGAWPGVNSFCGWKGSGGSGKGGCGPYYVAQFMREQSQTRMG